MDTNTANQPTVIDRLAEMISNHTTEQIAEMIAEIETLDGTDGTDPNRTLVKFACYEIIERRNPGIAPILEAWSSDLDDDRTYTQMMLSALAQLTTTN